MAVNMVKSYRAEVAAGRVRSEISRNNPNAFAAALQRPAERERTVARWYRTFGES